jgi:hypothetical protein
VFLTNPFKDVYLYEDNFLETTYDLVFSIFFNAFLKDTTSTMGGLQLSFVYGRRFSAVDLPSPGAVGPSSICWWLSDFTENGNENPSVIQIE